MLDENASRVPDSLALTETPAARAASRNFRKRSARGRRVASYWGNTFVEM